jgi:hemerythrin superfamily protein
LPETGPLRRCASHIAGEMLPIIGSCRNDQILNLEADMAARSTPDAISLLKADHRTVEDLFAKFEKARSDRKESLVRQICTELTVHTMIEEEIFYPACHGEIEDENVLEEAYVEHDGAKVLIAELLDSKADAEFYDAKVKVLSELIKHHVKEEERRAEGLFAEARAAGLDVGALAGQVKARKKELMAQFNNGTKLPPPQTRSYTGHKLVQGEPLAAPRSEA